MTQTPPLFAERGSPAIEIELTIRADGHVLRFSGAETRDLDSTAPYQRNTVAVMSALVEHAAREAVEYVSGAYGTPPPQ
jgi:hypothetical protein